MRKRRQQVGTGHDGSYTLHTTRIDAYQDPRIRTFPDVQQGTRSNISHSTSDSPCAAVEQEVANEEKRVLQHEEDNLQALIEEEVSCSCLPWDAAVIHRYSQAKLGDLIKNEGLHLSGEKPQQAHQETSAQKKEWEPFRQSDKQNEESSLEETSVREGHPEAVRPSEGEDVSQEKTEPVPSVTSITTLAEKEGKQVD